MYNVPTSGRGAAEYRRAQSAYLNTRNVIQRNLQRQGGATRQGMLVGVNYDRTMRVNSQRILGNANG